jgi:hypothetical protein
MMYRIAWQFRDGRNGHGDWVSDRAELEVWLDVLNAQYSDAQHWIESRPIDAVYKVAFNLPFGEDSKP